MSKNIQTPSSAKENLYQLLEEVNKDNTEVHIIDERSGNDAVLISLKEWQTIQETLYPEQTGVLSQIIEEDEIGFMTASDLPWNDL